MSLINELLQRPLDPGYAAAHQRRVAAGEPRHTSWGGALVSLTAVLIGLLFAVAAGAARQEAPTAGRVRADLITQIEQRRALIEERSRAIIERRGEIAGMQSSALGSDGASRQRLEQLSLAGGAVAVTGPGLVVSLNDRPAGETAEGGSTEEGRVLSRDLFIVVNALWESGAEAVAVNGQRLTVRSPIRFAGAAILVNFRPITPPYVINAVGDPDEMPERFAASLGGSYVKSLSDNFGIVSSVDIAPDLSLPAATRVTVDRARPLDGAS